MRACAWTCVFLRVYVSVCFSACLCVCCFANFAVAAFGLFFVWVIICIIISWLL